MKLKKKSVVAALTLSMSMGSVLSMVPVFAETSQQNLALNKTAYVSAEYGTMPRKNLTDGNEKTRWSTESGHILVLNQYMQLIHFIFLNMK